MHPELLLKIIASCENETLRKDFRSFFKKFFVQLNPTTILKWNWHIDCISEYLMAVHNKELSRLIINIPFRMLKSSICSVAFPAWSLGNNPSTKFMNISYADELSTSLSVQCRQIIESPLFGEIFPEFQLKRDQNQKTRFETIQNGYRYATSTGGGATGHGANILTADDYLSAKMAASEQERETAINNFNPVFRTRLNDPEKDAILIIEQRLHSKDLTGTLLQEGGYEHLCLPAIFNSRKTFSFGNFHKTVEEGELLQPDRLSSKVLKDFQLSLGSSQYAAQIQQNPMAPGGNMVKLPWFYRFDIEIARQIKYDTKVISVDSAYKSGELNDPSSFGLYGIKDNNINILDVKTERYEYPELKRQLILFINNYNPDYVLIEDKGSGQSLIQELKREKGIKCAIIGIKPEGDKTIRLSNCSGIIEAGMVGLPNYADWLYSFEDEITKFPKSDHDDQVDQLSQMLNWYKSRPMVELEFFTIQL